MDSRKIQIDLSQWASSEVAFRHGYASNFNEIVDAPHFIPILKRLYSAYLRTCRGLSIMDLGCGNMRLAHYCNLVMPSMFHYIGVDYNQTALASGIKKISQEKFFINFTAIQVDLNSPDLAVLDFTQELTPSFAIGKGAQHSALLTDSIPPIDICILDSTLCFLSEPLYLLDTLRPNISEFLITRSISSADEIGFYSWDGMDAYSINRKFSLEYFKRYCFSRGLTMQHFCPCHSDNSLYDTIVSITT